MGAPERGHRNGGTGTGAVVRGRWWAATQYVGNDTSTWRSTCVDPTKEYTTFLDSKGGIANVTGKLHIDSWDQLSVFLNLILFVVFKVGGHWLG